LIFKILIIAIDILKLINYFFNKALVIPFYKKMKHFYVRNYKILFEFIERKKRNKEFHIKSLSFNGPIQIISQEYFKISTRTEFSHLKRNRVLFITIMEKNFIFFSRFKRILQPFWNQKNQKLIRTYKLF
jgi:hypothetical protein